MQRSGEGGKIPELVEIRNIILLLVDFRKKGKGDWKEVKGWGGNEGNWGKGKIKGKSWQEEKDDCRPIHGKAEYMVDCDILHFFKIFLNLISNVTSL